MLSQLGRSIRKRALAIQNRDRLRRTLGTAVSDHKRLVFSLFTDEQMLFAPFCIPTDVPDIQPVILLNGVSRDDFEWISNIHPNVPIVRLRATLTNNQKSILPHAAVVNDLLTVLNQPFCLQDADCFAVDPAFYESLSLNVDQDYAAGPFVKMRTRCDVLMPHTYFLLFNPTLINRVQAKYGVSADITKSLPPVAAEKIHAIGYEPGQYPDTFKDYFDTLQALFLLLSAEGWNFKTLGGENSSIYHIGGTSYIRYSDCDLTHWDCWPLSVHYFNLRLLEFEINQRFVDRFKYLYDLHESTEQLLQAHPVFLRSNRCLWINELLESLEASHVAMTKKASSSGR